MWGVQLQDSTWAGHTISLVASHKPDTMQEQAQKHSVRIMSWTGHMYHLPVSLFLIQYCHMTFFLLFTPEMTDGFLIPHARPTPLLSAGGFQPHFPTNHLADVVKRKPLAGIGKPGIPLRGVLTNNGPSLPVFDTQSVNGVELVTDEIGASAQSLTERAEEALTSPVCENKTGVC